MYALAPVSGTPYSVNRPLTAQSWPHRQISLGRLLMNKFRTALFAASFVVAGAAFAGSASASSLIITDVETGNGDLGNVSVAGYGTPWTTPILMTTSDGKTLVVFCDDLNHTVNVGGGQSLPYHTGLVTVDGLGDMLTESVSNEMGQLANIGKYDFGHGDEDGAIAAQAAIWGLEYNTAVSSTDATIQADILQDLKVQDNGTGYATGLISDSGQQSQITGGVPEPAVWAMMLMGFGAIGGAMRSARRRAASALA
jgi:hypothetical protein